MVAGKGNRQTVVSIGATALRLVTIYLRGARQPPVRFAPCRLCLALPVAVTPHTFRRSCTTELIRGGANLWHVKELLGHEHFDTLQRYVKLTIAYLKKTHAKCHPRERES